MSTLEAGAAAGGDARARRTALLLSLAYAVGASASPIGVAVGGLVSLTLAPDAPALATVPITAMVVGSAISAAPAALLMQRVGRRTGFLIGAGAALAGAILAMAAIGAGSFWLFVAAQLLVGTSGAFAQQYRFAATDLAGPSFKARAISYVMAGGVVTGILGPQAAIHGRLLLATPFMGVFLLQALLAIIAMAILAFLSIPRPQRVTWDSTGRRLGLIVRQPRFLVALACACSAYGLMSFVMTAAPLAMVGGYHHSTDQATLAIQWHVVAMFAPSFATGALIARFGKVAVVAAGLALLAVGAAIALAGGEVWNFSLALIALGVGWNFGFIGATAMVAETYAPTEGPKVQALNEGVLFSIVAIASLSSGAVLTSSGWETMNIIVFPVVAIGLTALALLVLWERRRAAPSET